MLSPSVLNSTRVPRSWRICFLVRLIMPWRLPAWADITLPVAVTLKRFLAPDLVFSLGIWLSYGHRKTRPEGRFCGLKCSLERWKCSGFLENETTRTDVDTAALNQPGDEVRAYGRGSGNWQ